MKSADSKPTISGIHFRRFICSWSRILKVGEMLGYNVDSFRSVAVGYFFNFDPITAILCKGMITDAGPGTLFF